MQQTRIENNVIFDNNRTRIAIFQEALECRKVASVAPVFPCENGSAVPFFETGVIHANPLTRR